MVPVPGDGFINVAHRIMLTQCLWSSLRRTGGGDYTFFHLTEQAILQGEA